MPDFIKRRGADPSRLAQDVESSLARAKDATLEAAGQYTPGDHLQWVPPAPTTIQEALDRLAAAAGANPVP